MGKRRTSNLFLLRNRLTPYDISSCAVPYVNARTGSSEMAQWSTASRSRNMKMKMIRNLFLGVLSIFGLYTLCNSLAGPAMSPLGDRRQAQPRPTIGKVTMIYGNRSIYERGLKTHEEHARRFGYPVSVLRKPTLSGTYSKCAILLAEMLHELEKPADKRLEWLFWFDSDTVLMNANMPLEVFLPPPTLPDVHLLLTKDWNGLNNGVYFIRVNEWSVRLLSATIAYPSVNPDVTLAWQDQSALSNLLDENEYFRKHTVYCPLRWFNAYMRSPDALRPNPDSPEHLQVHPGDLLVHFPGTPSDHLDQTLTPYLEIAENHAAEWELPLEQTGYIEETKEFWAKVT